MNIPQGKPGYILVLTLMMIALGLFLSVYIAERSSTYGSFIRTIIDRKKAYHLAQSGIQIGIAQLCAKTEQSKESVAGGAGKLPSAAQFVSDVVPLLNTWQQFALNEESDAVDGIVNIYIVSECGKINLNALFDFKKHDFKKPEYAEFVKTILANVGKQVGAPNLNDALVAAMKKRNDPMDEVTELLTLEPFAAFKNNVWIRPQPGSVFLADLFTVATDGQIDPLQLSQSTAIACGFPPIAPGNKPNAAQTIFKDFKGGFQWPTSWQKYLQPWWGRDFSTLPKGMQSLLSNVMRMDLYTIVCHATVGHVTQRLVALVERAETGVGKESKLTCTIRKQYWL